MSPPRGWPECFNDSELQSYLTEIRGQRVRLCARAGPADAAKVSKLKLSATDTLSNAQKVSKATGWSVIGGYILYGRVFATSGKFAAEQRWWNAKFNKDGTSGKCV